MRLDEAPLMERQDFTHLECRDVFMWNVLSTQRCLSTFCSISLALSLPVLSRSLLTPSTRLTSLFCPIKTLMGSISCAPVESENVTKDNFSPVIERSGKHLRPDGAGAPILANLTHGSQSWPRGEWQILASFAILLCVI